MFIILCLDISFTIILVGMKVSSREQFLLAWKTWCRGNQFVVFVLNRGQDLLFKKKFKVKSGHVYLDPRVANFYVRSETHTGDVRFRYLAKAARYTQVKPTSHSPATRLSKQCSLQAEPEPNS